MWYSRISLTLSFDLKKGASYYTKKWHLFSWCNFSCPFNRKIPLWWKNTKRCLWKQQKYGVWSLKTWILRHWSKFLRPPKENAIKKWITKAFSKRMSLSSKSQFFNPWSNRLKKQPFTRSNLRRFCYMKLLK